MLRGEGGARDTVEIVETGGRGGRGGGGGGGGGGGVGMLDCGGTTEERTEGKQRRRTQHWFVSRIASPGTVLKPQ